MSACTSFTYVPRQVAKSSKTSKNVSRGKDSTLQHPLAVTSASNSPADADAKEDIGKPKPAEKNAGKYNYSDEDCAMLVSLALSDHALWSNPDVRRILDWNIEGFIPLSQLLRHSPILKSFDLADSEVSVAKALRLCASDELDVRMLVSGPSKSNWYKGKQTSAPAALGGYEVRRRDWLDAAYRPSKEFSKNDWEQRILYLEGIPPHYRTISGIARFIRSLLPEDSNTPTKPMSRIQNITLPPHHQDALDEQPKCKGMCLTTLARMEDLQSLSREWPWDRDHDLIKKDESNKEVEEAVKFGFRTLLKVRWDQLNEEYLTYRRALLDEIATSENIAAVSSSSTTVHETDPAPASAPAPRPVPQTDLSSPYPLNCLVFVRNIHTESNKTTLRALFSAAFKTAAADTQVQGGLDYVDFNKGTDSCHIRLATPQHTQILVDHFTEHPTMQARGLDDTGKALQPSETGIAITMEVVQGKKEALYWEKVPEKVRRQAVHTAIGYVPSDLGDTRESVGGEVRRRKKRKHNN